jgi:outer membrane protein assembly factor BamB
MIVGDEQDRFRLAAVDAATGIPRWSLEELDPLPGGDGAKLFRPELLHPEPRDAPIVAGPHGDSLVYVPYLRSDDCTHPTGWCPREEGETPSGERGIAALSERDGSVRWMTPVLSSTETQHMDVRLLVANDDLVLIRISDFSNDLASLRTVALSTTDGSRRWEQSGVVAEFITDSAVIGRIPRTPDDVARLFVAPEGTVVALDPTSGNRRWSLSDSYVDSSPMLVAGHFIVARVESPDAKANTLVMDAATGQEVARLGKSSISCSSDSSSLIACVDTMRNTLITLHLDEREVRVSGNSIDGDSDISYLSSEVWRGRVFIEDAATSGHPTRHLVVDRSANVLTDQSPGQIVAISDDYAIFRTTEGGHISVHSVTP